MVLEIEGAEDMDVPRKWRNPMESWKKLRACELKACHEN